MSGTTVIIAAAFFLVALLAIAAIMAWQEARAGGQDEPVYVINDAVEAVWEQLDPEVRQRVKRAGVRRIIEWEVHYLQGLADRKAARQGITVVAGGDDRAVDYIVRQLGGRGFTYDPDDVRQVLAGEAGYLLSIGAVGEAAGEEA